MTGGFPVCKSLRATQVWRCHPVWHRNRFLKVHEIKVDSLCGRPPTSLLKGRTRGRVVVRVTLCRSDGQAVSVALAHPLPGSRPPPNFSPFLDSLFWKSGDCPSRSSEQVPGFVQLPLDYAGTGAHDPPPPLPTYLPLGGRSRPALESALPGRREPGLWLGLRITRPRAERAASSLPRLPPALFLDVPLFWLQC